MVYQNVTYNIPIVLWLMETYPRHPPCVFLNPTRDMIIKRPHPHVNPSGLVSIPYLHNWIYPSSNLLDLARHLTHIFGRDPPLYTRQTPTTPNRPLNPNPNPNPNPPIDHNPRPSRLSSASSLGSPYGAGAGAGAGCPPHHHHHHHRPSFSDDPNEVYRKNAINNILATVHADVAALRRNREAEMEGMFSAQAVLRQREEVLGKGFREMQDEKEGLEQQLQMVLMNSDVLEVWLRDNEGKPKMTTVDDVFEPCDVLSKQMLECTASDLAIEDLVYGLDKAVQEGSIPFDLYLKNIRSLSREQFFHRATAAKVRAAQMQAHVASMAARTSQYAL
ncbi:hypothetical protein Sjap_018963 [Stephania japonica]|uniref:Protein ELC-like n=1 Tax=Stephania japonica TaxID=461633 RepID=A0AAP0F6T1_9MAGN